MAPTKQQLAQAKARAGGNNPIKITDKKLKKLGSVASELLGANDAKDIINKAHKGDIGGALKSTAVAAAMFLPAGKVLKVARIASKATKAAKAAEAEKKYAAASAGVRKSLAKKPEAAKPIIKKERPAIIKEAEGRKASPRYQTQADRGVTNTVREPVVRTKAQGKKQIKNPKPIVQPQRPNPGRGTSAIPVTNRVGLRTTTGQGRKKVSDVDAKDVSKELGRRPFAPRPRDVPRGSSNSLTASEKRGIQKIDTITRPKPNVPKTRKEIANENYAKKVKAREERTVNPRRVSKKPAPKLKNNLPAHKTDVKIMRKKLHNKGVQKKEHEAADYTVTRKDFRGNEYEVRKSDIEASKEANANAASDPRNSTAPPTREILSQIERKRLEKIDNPPRLGRLGPGNIALREKRIQVAEAKRDYDAIESQRNRLALLNSIKASIKKSKTPNRPPNELERKLIAQVRKDKNRPHIPRVLDPKYTGRPKSNADKYEGPVYTDSWATRESTARTKAGIKEANRVQKASLARKDAKVSSKSEIAKVDKTLAEAKKTRISRRVVEKPKARLSKTRPLGK